MARLPSALRHLAKCIAEPVRIVQARNGLHLPRYIFECKPHSDSFTGYCQEPALQLVAKKRLSLNEGNTRVLSEYPKFGSNAGTSLSINRGLLFSAKKTKYDAPFLGRLLDTKHRNILSDLKAPSLHSAKFFSSDSKNVKATGFLGWIQNASPLKLSSLSSIQNQLATQQLLPTTVQSTVRKFAGKYRDAAGLQVEAFWRQYYPFILGGAAFIATMFIWKAMFGIATTFMNLSEGLAKFGFLALASSTVAFSALYLRSRFIINPDAVYRRAMRTLQVNAKVLEVLGAPLTGSEVRAYVMSGGRLRLKNWRLGLSSHRCFLIFPVRGSERKGLASVAVKKKSGKYDIRMLAVDVPTTSSSDHRLFIIGDESNYNDSGGVIAELRDPIIRALAKQKDFDLEDDKEDAGEVTAKDSKEKQLEK